MTEFDITSTGLPCVRRPPATKLCTLSSLVCNKKLVTMQRPEPPRATSVAAALSTARWSIPSTWASANRKKEYSVSDSSPSSSPTSSLLNISIKQNWWCTSCRRPREECECLCVIS